jgi:hypothetical protein
MPDASPVMAGLDPAISPGLVQMAGSSPAMTNGTAG